jgi:hypothetical protein
MRTRALAPLVASLLASAVPASASDQQACVDAYERAQPLRAQGKLLATRAELLTCAQPSCPEAVASECTRWLREVDDATPSLVPSARDGATDLVDVRVFLDGKPITERLEGTAFPVDPGEHSLRFERRGAGQVTTRVVMRQGEKNRIVTVQLAAPTRAPAPRPTPPLAAYVLAGVAVAAMAVGAALDVSASSDLRRLHDTCAPTCSPDARDEVRRRMIAGDVLVFGVGTLSLGAAAYLFFASRAHE